MKRGEVWWAPVDGIRRPVVVLTRDAMLPYLSRVTVAPVTRSSRGIPSEVALVPEFDAVLEASVASLDNVITLPKGHLTDRIGPVSAPTLHALCDALTFALGC